MLALISTRSSAASQMPVREIAGTFDAYAGSLQGQGRQKAKNAFKDVSNKGRHSFQGQGLQGPALQGQFFKAAKAFKAKAKILAKLLGTKTSRECSQIFWQRYWQSCCCSAPGKAKSAVKDVGNKRPKLPRTGPQGQGLQGQGLQDQPRP